MSEQKKSDAAAEKPAAESKSKRTVVINRSPRRFALKPLVTTDKDGKQTVTKRELRAGESIETLDDAEAAHLLSFTHDIVDAAKAVPQTASHIDVLQKKNAELEKQIAELRAELDEKKGKGK